MELAQITMKFAQNVVDATAAFEHYIEDEQELAGLPESAIEAARETRAARTVRVGGLRCKCPATRR